MQIGNLAIASPDDGRAIHFVHSTLDPRGDARQWASRWTAREGTIIVYGLGLGAHVHALAEAAPAANIIVVDPHVSDAIGRAFRCDRVAVTKDWQSFKVAYCAVINRWKPIAVTALPAYEHCYRAEYLEFLRRMTREIQAVISDRCTAIRFSYEWQNNLLKNLRLIRQLPPIAPAFGTFTGPAIIVGAGPSLDNNFRLLEQAKGKALIIAAGSALRKLVDAGIEPDLAMVFDGGSYNFLNHFEGLRAEVPLVLDLIAHHKIAEEYSGPKALMTIWPSNDVLKGALGCDIGNVAIGPSVASSALDFAVKLGAGPIILAGVDLAYTGGRTHADGTHAASTVDARYNYDLSRLPAQELLGAVAADGSAVKTSPSMLTFRHWFEEYIGRLQNVRIINASQGGLAIAGTETMDLGSALREFCEQDRREQLQALRTKITQPPAYNITGLSKYLRAVRLACRQLRIQSRKSGVNWATEIQKPLHALIGFGLQIAWDYIQLGTGEDVIRAEVERAADYTLPLLDETIDCLEAS